MPSMSLASHASDSDVQSVSDAATEEQADTWMKDYQRLLGTRDDNRRLGELHENLSNYRLADTERFDKQFGTTNGVIREHGDLGKSMKSHPSVKHSDQTQQNAPVHDNSTPNPDSPIPSIEQGDIEMEDLGVYRRTEDQSAPTQNDRLDVPNDPNHSDVRSSREQSVGSLGRGFNRLAILDPPKGKNQGRITQSPAPDPKDIVDGWGTWRGNSGFVIVQEGPPEAARFTFKLRSKYSNERTANISDKQLRISEIRDLGVGGKKPYRYTSENVAGVFGAAFEDTGVRISTRNPCSWARVEWQGLRDEDMIKCKITEGYSWIPKTDFERLCHGREATEAKIKEVWDSQEQQYAAWAQKRPGSENRSRATTPCPLNASLIRLQQQKATSRRATSRFRTPDLRISAPAVDDDGTPPLSRQNDVTGTRSNPVSLDEESQNVNSPAPSGLTPAIATSRELNNQGTPGPHGQTPIFEFSKAEFMKKRSEKWKDMNPSEREKEEVISEALYELHRATMLQGGAREVVDLSTPVSVEEEL
ncbi:hypothetical protein N7466_001450 [Penicillium verhagenii]|uniref:uncharacterized protein n=1 Tax=Penicillium verhagenii TaxID=1562060 RepID=UPI002544DD00|nr:uncharacterized protein N7466_001450 [Penicillium verhagenii]KAJ5938316.1 hypothetical protein N7466_001450 [Penicillium verhagenii]